MSKNKRVLCATTLATAVVAALSAFASGQITGNAPAIVSGSVATVGAGAMASPSANRFVPMAAPVQASSFDRFIVRYNDATRSTQSGVMSAFNAAATRAGVAGLALSANGTRSVLRAEHVRRMATGADVVRLSRKLSRSETDALLAQLRNDPAVKYAQPDYIKQRSDVVPDDKYYGTLQWHYDDPIGGINMPKAWEIANGAGVVVAVLDTGYLDHADLSANIIPGYDFVHDPEIDGDGEDGRDADAHDPGDWYGGNDSSWHGSHVAGTIAAVTNNTIGVAGVAFGARVQPVRVLGHGGGYTSDIADAITWASGGSVDGVPANPTPAEVINMSLGGQGACDEDPVTQDAIDGAISRGVTVVVAAGNSNADAAFFSPASCKGVITVGATGNTGARSVYSNFGAAVTLSAPGGDHTTGSAPDYGVIWSVGNTGAQEPVPASQGGDVYSGMEGTSMASPHVAAVVALMQSAANIAGRPALTPAQVKSMLRNTARAFPVTPPASKPQGVGIVDAAAAAYAATQDVPVDTGELLANRVAVGGQTGAAGESRLFKIVVPAGKTSLNLRSYGGSGDVSVYVAFERAPTETSFDRRSAKPGNSETVVLSRPAAGTYYMLVVGETPFADVSVMGLY